MKFRIHDSNSKDSFIVDCDTLEKCYLEGNAGADKRNYIRPWSERMDKRQNCNNCKYRGDYPGYTPCEDCQDLDKWEQSQVPP